MPDNGENTAPVEGAEQNNPATPDPATGEEALGDAGKQALDRMKADKKAAETEAKTLRAELDKIRQASMSETERAVAEAKAAGRTEAASEFGKELAREKFDALAGRRNADFDTAKALEYVDLSKFLGEDGRPDPKAIAAAVERLVPQAAGGPPSFDGGPRGTAPKGGDMNSLLRQAAGRQ